MGLGTNMAKSKNHAQPVPKRHRNSIKKPQSQRHESLKGVDPNFLRNIHFAKKHSKKSSKKMQANNAKTMNACAMAIKDIIKPKGLGLCWPKAKAKARTKPQAADAAQTQARAQNQAPKGVRVPTKSP
ncbi:60S ribosomal protein L29-like [Pteronotus mesoamericanus]|uniref:60S ribosomal protein L29-like n=1 Tax=Pteronotus mesoamericanus TaxID=1884717 RepID=UPI0023EB0E8A|nr:60S ribosomal protein L29-like [Pteronotus parnellii mesoamericanus]